jgi:hypothetical protein
MIDRRKSPDGRPPMGMMERRANAKNRPPFRTALVMVGIALACLFATPSRARHDLRVNAGFAPAGTAAAAATLSTERSSTR